MEKKGISIIKSKQFAIRIVGLYNHLITKKEYVMAKQVLRSGTSIGANLAEAQCAISRKEFLAKLYIALKECSETQYWLDLLHDTSYISDLEYTSVAADCEELRKILSSATLRLRNTM